MKKQILLKTTLILGTALGLTGCALFPATPVEKELVVTDSKKTNYNLGDVFDNYINNGGLYVDLKYSDNSQKRLTKNDFTYEIHLGDASYSGKQAFTKAGSYTVSVTKGSLAKVDYTIVVKPDGPVETEFSISDSRKSAYYIDDVFDEYIDNGGMVVKVKMSDNTTKTLSKSDYTYSISTGGESHDGKTPFTKTGTYSITLKRTGINDFTYSITVKENSSTRTLTKIEAKNYTKTYTVGDTFAFDGKVTAYFSNGTTKALTSSEYTVTEPDTSSAGTKTGSISYTYEGVTKTTTITITVETLKDLTKVEATNYSTEIRQNSDYSFDGKVTAYFSDSSTRILTSTEYSVTKPSTATLGTATGTISYTYRGVTKTATITVTIVEAKNAAWTLLIYMCGADLESASGSDGGCATADLTEINNVKSHMDSDVNIVIQAGGAKSWKSTFSSVINKDKCNRFHLTSSGYVKDSQTDKVNMGLETTLKDFLQWGLETYPADKVGLVFWNHGGAMSGCCYDEQFGDDALTPAEVASAIPSAISASGYNKNLEFIGYDCCLMSVQDIAGLNSDYANYMIASEEAEWGYGWSYDKWVDDLLDKKDTETILKACVDGFYEDTEEAYAEYGEINDQTLAYYNLKNWSTYETAWENFSSYLSSDIIKSSSNWKTFKNVVNTAKKYGKYEESDAQPYNNGYLMDIFDTKDVINKLKASSSYNSNATFMSKISDVETAFAGLEIYGKYGDGAGNSNGIAMFCPISGYNSKSEVYSADNTCFTAWRSLCSSYGSWYSGY